MQIEKVEPENRIEGFVRKFDAPDWRDPELNLYLTLTRATDPAPPEKPRPPYVDPYDDPYPLFRKVPRKPDPSPPIVKLQHIAPKTILYVDPKPMQSMVTDVLRNYGEHPLYLKTTHERDYQEAVACFQLRCAVVQWPDKYVWIFRTRSFVKHMYWAISFFWFKDYCLYCSDVILHREEHL